MKKLFLFSVGICFSSVLWAGTINLTNDTVYVKTPTTNPEAATKKYVDDVGAAAGASDWDIPLRFENVHTTGETQNIAVVRGTTLDVDGGVNWKMYDAFACSETSAQEGKAYAGITIPYDYAAVTNLRFGFKQNQSTNYPVILKFSLVGDDANSQTVTGTVTTADTLEYHNWVPDAFLTNSVGKGVLVRAYCSLLSTNASTTAYRGIYKWTKLQK